MSNFTQFPLSQIEYLDKHRIYDIFYELARDLVIHQPVDHVAFIALILRNATKTAEQSQVIFIGGTLNYKYLAVEVAKITGHYIISTQTILDYAGLEMDNISPKRKAQILLNISKENPKWIINCIHSEDEALELVKVGIYPTHLIHVILPHQNDLTELVYCNVSKYWPEKRRNLAGIRKIFENSLRELYALERPIKHIIDECVETLGRKTIKVQIKPRVVLIGNSNEDEIKQAQFIEQKLNLIHGKVDAIKLRTKYAVSHPDFNVNDMESIINEIINEQILEEDCLKEGWIITGFAKYDYWSMIEYLELPPNRIIFLDKSPPENCIPQMAKYCELSYIKAGLSATWKHESIMAIITNTTVKAEPCKSNNKYE